MNEVLARIVAEIEAAPRSAAALTLYALVATLEFERAGYLFKLAKLRDLSAAQRQLAYQLIEAVIGGTDRGAEWQRAKTHLDGLVRAG